MPQKHCPLPSKKIKPQLTLVGWSHRPSSPFLPLLLVFLPLPPLPPPLLLLLLLAVAQRKPSGSGRRANSPFVRGSFARSGSGPAALSDPGLSRRPSATAAVTWRGGARAIERHPSESSLQLGFVRPFNNAFQAGGSASAGSGGDGEKLEHGRFGRLSDTHRSSVAATSNLVALAAAGNTIVSSSACAQHIKSPPPPRLPLSPTFSKVGGDRSDTRRLSTPKRRLKERIERRRTSAEAVDKVQVDSGANSAPAGGGGTGNGGKHRNSDGNGEGNKGDTKTNGCGNAQLAATWQADEGNSVC